MTVKYLKKAIKTPITDEEITRERVQEVLKQIEKKKTKL